jgi:glycosyltransferase involved in cell wall biosynthesis
MMAQFPIFLSIVLVARNQSALLEQAVRQTIAVVELLVSDYEVIVVDNGSDDASVGMLKGLTSEHGLPNMQVYALTKEVDRDAASWVGVENALGDYIAVVDITTDDIHFLPTMLNSAVSGADVVFTKNLVRSAQSLGYRLSFSAFNFLYSRFNGVNLQREAPMFRLLNKRVANFILQHPQPALTYRHLPATGGFAKVNLEYSHVPREPNVKKLAEGWDRGIRLLVSTTRAPMRLVTTLSMFGALANLIYSGYIIEIAIFKENVAPGWVTMSLQNSGMFFLISLVLLVLGEYILHMANLSTEGPLYHVAQEFTSAVMTRKNKLNIETVDNSAGLAIASASPRVDPVEAIADGRHE